MTREACTRRGGATFLCMALPRRLLQVPAGLSFNPGPNGQPAKQFGAPHAPPGPSAPAPAPAGLVPSLSGVAMASVIASETFAQHGLVSLMLASSCCVL